MENQKLFVEKFGGASVNSASAVKNVKQILSLQDKKRFVVISAMGKTTNKLETIVNTWFTRKEFHEQQFQELKDYHKKIIEELFDKDSCKDCLHKTDLLFEQLKEKTLSTPDQDYNFLYDSIVSFGERISTLIVSEYLNFCGMENKLISSKDIIKTDNNYRDANIEWEQTKQALQKVLSKYQDYKLFITQGFVGGSKEGLYTTLGREGSDYSAAVIAHCLQAETMTIWKDVPGLLNADPKRIDKTTKLCSVPYSEAIELSYYGASIIHPKTIKPLQNLNIPLYIKSFLSPATEGSVICSNRTLQPKVTNYIFKDKQVLLSVCPKDFSFIDEKNIASIFEILSANKVKANLIQNSAISFSICFDENDNILPQLLKDLRKDYKVKYNTSLQLITMRHYNNKTTDNILKNKKILIEQRSRTTAQFLVE